MACKQFFLIYLCTVLLVLILLRDLKQDDRNFEMKNNRFVLNGKEIQLVSGSIHYFRIHPQYWQDRLQRVKSVGLNAIQIYIPWNFHEQEPGVFSWDGWQDIELFIQLAKEEGLLVLLRPGPYICAEWDNGGLPPWLLNPNITHTHPSQIKFRSMDSTYIKFVDRWWGELLPRMKPLLYENGGPIVMVQIENEFGFMGPDEPYLRHLQELARMYLGDNVILYTTDPPSVAKYGTLNGDSVLTAVDFGPFWYDPNYAFKVARQFNPPGKSAPICTEFYSGWLTHWKEKMPRKSAGTLAAATIGVLKSANFTGSLNFYMVHGGTSFGFWAGANYGASYQPDITSYDYDAIIREGGGQGYGYGGGIAQVQGQALGQRYLENQQIGNLQNDQIYQLQENKKYQGSAHGEVQGYFEGQSISNLQKKQFQQYVYDQYQNFYNMSQSNDWTKYVAIRNVLKSVLNIQLPDRMDEPQFKSYGQIQFEKFIFFQDVVEELSMVQGGIPSPSPLHMEHYGQYYGMIVYRKQIKNEFLCNNKTNSLAFTARDYAIVLVNYKNVGFKWINQNQKNVHFSVDCEIQDLNETTQIDIVVEAMGRNNFFKSDLSKNLKGIIGPVKLNENMELFYWTVFPLPLSNNLSDILQSKSKNITQSIFNLNLNKYSNNNKQLLYGSSFEDSFQNNSLNSQIQEGQSQGLHANNNNTVIKGDISRQQLQFTQQSVPIFLVGTFLIEEQPVDTYIDVLQWHKGVIWVNKFNLGRYWTDMGPQFTLYVPKYVLKQGENEVILLELANISASSQLSVKSVAQPNFLYEDQTPKILYKEQ